MDSIKKGNEFYMELISPETNRSSFIGMLSVQKPAEQIITIKEKLDKTNEICDYYFTEKERLKSNGEEKSHLVDMINLILAERDKLVKLISNHEAEKKSHDIYVSFLNILGILTTIDPEAEKELIVAKRKIDACEKIKKLKKENYEKEITKLDAIISKNKALMEEYSKI